MIRLNNGIRVLVRPMQGLMSVSVGVMIGVGSAYESASENGISHYIEHMMFKGTQTRTALELSEFVDDFGGQINAFTSKDATCYYVKCTQEHVSRAFDVLSDMLQNSLFSESEQKKEKGVILEEIHMCEDTPDELCMDLSALSLFGNQGFGRAIIGTEENVKRFNGEEIRTFMQKHYCTENIVISVAGNVQEEEVYTFAKRYFGEMEARSYTAAMPDTVYRTGAEYRSKKIEQTHLTLSFPCYPHDHEMSAALSLVNVILGGSMSSRLFQKVREELGAAYSVYSTRASYAKGGEFVVYAGVNPDRAAEAVSETAKVIKDFTAQGVTEREFRRVKEQMKASFAFGQENVSTQMLAMGKHMLVAGEIFDHEKKLREMNAVTLPMVNAAAREILDMSKVAVAAVFVEGKEADLVAAVRAAQ